jgi:hypothetical protein
VLQLAALDDPLEPERLAPPPKVLASGLALARVVVLRARRDRQLVVGMMTRSELPDRQHD